MSSVLREVEGMLAEHGSTDGALLALLDRVLGHFACQVGTIHEMDAPRRVLRLRAQRGLPDAILDRVRAIPLGKGMAGIAAERREPVQVCNLQTDASGVARPDARLTRMEGSIAVPMLVGGVVRGTLGVAKPTPHAFTAEESALLLALGSRIGASFEGRVG
jgi:L-methionine (R)-S-oxide reductase